MNSYENILANIKKGHFEKVYVLYGLEGILIKECVDVIIDKALHNNFLDLNLIKLDGAKTNFDIIYNACETLPFMNEKKVVLIKNAVFLSDNKSAKTENNANELHKELKKYIEKVPEDCILILYYIFTDNREKPSKKITSLDDKAYLVQFNRLKGEALQKKVEDYFIKKGRAIDKNELSLFVSLCSSNIEIIFQEADKLMDYTKDRDIKKEDIMKMLSKKEEDDIFKLVDYISDKKPEKAIDVLNELYFRGEKFNSILSMIERQFRLILFFKGGTECGKSIEDLAREQRIHPYVAQNMLRQSRRFTYENLEKAIEACLDAETRLKSVTSNDKIEMELMIINMFK